MNTRKTSALKTFIEYLGRGAVPVDGSYGVEIARTSSTANATNGNRLSGKPLTAVHCSPADALEQLGIADTHGIRGLS